MAKMLVAALAAVFAFTPARAADAPTRVTIIATIHGLHGKSAGYSYDRLYSLVRSLKPDYVGVEIRQEDIPRDDKKYLESMYPAEMIAMAREYGPRAFGFDWLGDEIANEPVPPDFWASKSAVKKLERDLDADPQYKNDKQLDDISAQEKAILAAATPAGMNDGRYDRLNEAYYARAAQLYAGSKYDYLARFYAERDFQIALNIAAAIKAHPGSNIVVLTGADHRSALLRHLKSWFGDSISLPPVPR